MKPFAFILGLTMLSGCAASTPPETVRAEAPSTGATYSLEAIRSVGKHKGDYLPAHNFKLEIDGVLVGGFKELAMNIDGKAAADIKTILDLEGAFKDGDDAITHKRAGKAKYKNIMLRRGFVADPDVEAWFADAAKDPTARKSGSIIYLDREGREVLRYSFTGAWPVVTKDKKVIMDRDSGVAIAPEFELNFDQFERLKTRHDTVKNSIGNIR
ncbi:MAG: phage tail protein [Cyanobacteria bacterium RYN_339]|nr:phage tail protein [Cyanobacteria bacterium RYN_339]